MLKKNCFCLMICLLLMIGVCGCTMNNSDLSKNTSSGVSLTERQQSILTEQGLSTDYDKLTSTQQHAIVAIEEMLKYVESKYNESFSYAGFSAANSLEKEYMRAYPSGGEKETDSFTITKTDDGFKDDYLNVASNEAFSSFICSNVCDICSTSNIKVFSKITSTSLEEKATENTLFDGKVEASLWIFIDGENFKEENLPDFNNRFEQFMKEHKLYGITQVVLLKDGKFIYLTKYNYTDYLSEDVYIARKTINIKK